MIKRTPLDFSVENGRATFSKSDGNFLIDFSDIPKWEKQNSATLIEYFGGCLTDNYLYSTKRGFVAIYEKYINPNASTNIGYFFPYKDTNNCAALIRNFLAATCNARKDTFEKCANCENRFCNDCYPD